ncbi:hypothetical protein H0O00_01285, partial [Candidatus Micrarchaeota archaeon]|nr:hypothetical protein [Candidatus Micrarchaeota archaeon]
MNKIILFGLVMVMGLAFAVPSDGVPPYMANEVDRAECIDMVTHNMANYGRDVYCGDNAQCKSDFDVQWGVCNSADSVYHKTYDWHDYPAANQYFVDTVRYFSQFRTVYLRYGFLWAF